MKTSLSLPKATQSSKSSATSTGVVNPVNKVTSSAAIDKGEAFSSNSFVAKDHVRDAIKEVITKEKLKESTNNGSEQQGLSDLPLLIKPIRAVEKVQSPVHKPSLSMHSNISSASKSSKGQSNKTISSKKYSNSSQSASSSKPLTNTLKHNLENVTLSKPIVQKTANNDNNNIADLNSSNHQSPNNNNASILSKQLSIDLSGSFISGDRCGECDACRITLDCGQCHVCRATAHDTCVRRRCKNMVSHIPNVTNSVSDKEVI